MKENEYAGVADRIKAMFIDNLVIIFLLFMVTKILSGYEPLPDWTRPMALILIFLLYDPLFTSAFGGTIGHKMIGIRVNRQKDQSRNLPYPLAVIRYFIKLVMGIVSLFIVNVQNNTERQAIHDYLVNSVVIIKENNSANNDGSQETE